jgi:hypothetical protein
MIYFILSDMGSSYGVEIFFHPAPTSPNSGKKERVRKVVEKLYVPSSRPPLAYHHLVYPLGVFYFQSINGTLNFMMEIEVLENHGNIYNGTTLCHPDRERKESTYFHLVLGEIILCIIKENH